MSHAACPLSSVYASEIDFGSRLLYLYNPVIPRHSVARCLLYIPLPMARAQASARGTARNACHGQSPHICATTGSVITEAIGPCSNAVPLSFLGLNKSTGQDADPLLHYPLLDGPLAFDSVQ